MSIQTGTKLSSLCTHRLFPAIKCISYTTLRLLRSNHLTRIKSIELFWKIVHSGYWYLVHRQRTANGHGIHRGLEGGVASNVERVWAGGARAGTGRTPAKIFILIRKQKPEKCFEIRHSDLLLRAKIITTTTTTTTTGGEWNGKNRFWVDDVKHRW